MTEQPVAEPSKKRRAAIGCAWIVTGVLLAIIAIGAFSSTVEQRKSEAAAGANEQGAPNATTPAAIVPAPQIVARSAGPPTPVAPPPPPQPSPKEVYVADAHKLIEVMKVCDDAVDAIGAAAKRGNVYAVYDAAASAHTQCADTKDQIAAFKWQPSVPDRKLLDTINSRCAEAYEVRASQLSLEAEAVNGDASPKAVHDIKALRDLSDLGVLRCMVSVSAAGTAVGATVTDLFPEAPQPPKRRR